jgi:hypothetical protein
MRLLLLLRWNDDDRSGSAFRTLAHLILPAPHIILFTALSEQEACPSVEDKFLGFI